MKVYNFCKYVLYIAFISTWESCGELSSGSKHSIPSMVPCGWGEVLPRLQGSVCGPFSPSCWMSVVRLTDIFLGEGRGWEWGGGWVENPGVAVKNKRGMVSEENSGFWHNLNFNQPKTPDQKGEKQKQF